jgi:hypothetical protein
MRVLVKIILIIIVLHLSFYWTWYLFLKYRKNTVWCMLGDFHF